MADNNDQCKNIMSELRYVSRTINRVLMKSDRKVNTHFYALNICRINFLCREQLEAEKLNIRKLRRIGFLFIKIKTKWMEDFQDIEYPELLHNGMIGVTGDRPAIVYVKRNQTVMKAGCWDAVPSS